MKITKSMTKVSNCKDASRSCNVSRKCHALAITVGGQNDQQCDTVCQADAIRIGLNNNTGKPEACLFQKNNATVFQNIPAVMGG